VIRGHDTASSSARRDLPHDVVPCAHHPAVQHPAAAQESRGARGVYWDGGATIQAALRADLVDELVVTTVPCGPVSVELSTMTWTGS
jgi:riboflavin biosynthesis pyrimidine reductase